MTSKAEEYAEKAAELLRSAERRQRSGKAPCEWTTSCFSEVQANALLALYWQKEEEKDHHA
ncbi:hypothetical protein [Streptomyces sp. NPDC046925]|uniref:hypothetical protein n=1 Tax=Streptomyces sp. NPDC046925 TaxID=3155375 RepID=UPI00341122A4